MLIHGDSCGDSCIEAAAWKAENLARAGTDEYENEAGKMVTWKLKELLDIVQLNDAAMGEGSEVYHQYLDAADVEKVRAPLRSGTL